MSSAVLAKARGHGLHRIVVWGKLLKPAMTVHSKPEFPKLLAVRLYCRRFAFEFTHDVERELQASRRPQRRRLVRPFPSELRLITAKVAIRCRLLINRAEQIEHLNDAFGAQVKVFLHQL